MFVPCPGTWCEDFPDSTHSVHTGASSSTASSAHQKAWPRGRLTWMNAVPSRPRAVPHGDRPGHTRTEQALVTALLQRRWALGSLAECGTQRRIVSQVLFFWSKNEGIGPQLEFKCSGRTTCIPFYHTLSTSLVTSSQHTMNEFGNSECKTNDVVTLFSVVGI